MNAIAFPTLTRKTIPPKAFWQAVVIGLGCYDVQPKPRDKSNPAFILELKNIDEARKTRLKDETWLKREVLEALKQIEDNKYYAELVMEEYPLIHRLRLAFKGQLCLIGDEKSMKTVKTRNKKT